MNTYEAVALSSSCNPVGLGTALPTNRTPATSRRPLWKLTSGDRPAEILDTLVQMSLVACVLASLAICAWRLASMSVVSPSSASASASTAQMAPHAPAFVVPHLPAAISTSLPSCNLTLPANGF